MSIIIVSWNVRSLLVKCIQALLSPGVSGSLRLEIIVVDNASGDGSADAARQFPQVEVLEASRNLGYGRANNLGMSRARAPYILVLNPDTEPKPGSLETLVSFMEGCEGAGIASPRLLNRDGSVQEAAFRFPTLWMAFFDLLPLPRIIPGRIRRALLRSPLNGRYPREANTNEPFRIDHPLGACMLIRGEAYTGAGGFNPGIYMYSEEIDLALRYRSAGWECWQVPGAEVLHLGGGSTAQVPDRMYVELWRSRLYVYRQHYSGTALRLLILLLGLAQTYYVLRDLTRLALGRVSREQARRTWKRAGAIMRLIRNAS